MLLPAVAIGFSFARLNTNFAKKFALVEFVYSTGLTSLCRSYKYHGCSVLKVYAPAKASTNIQTLEKEHI